MLWKENATVLVDAITALSRSGLTATLAREATEKATTTSHGAKKAAHLTREY